MEHTKETCLTALANCVTATEEALIELHAAPGFSPKTADLVRAMQNLMDEFNKL